jgi:hypothetical protein
LYDSVQACRSAENAEYSDLRELRRSPPVTDRIDPVLRNVRIMELGLKGRNSITYVTA